MDILQPDIAICSGFTGTARVVALAEAHGRALLPHVWGSTVNFHAALQLAATLPNYRAGTGIFPWLEYDMGENPLRDLAGRPALAADGTLAIPDGPGLGFELDPALLAPLTVWQRNLE